MKKTFFKAALLFLLLLFFIPKSLSAKGKNDLRLVGDVPFPVTIVAGTDVYTDVTLPIDIDVKKAKFLFIYAPGYRAQTVKLERSGHNVVGMMAFGIAAYKKSKLLATEIDVTLDPSDITERYLTDIATFYYDNGEKKEAVTYLNSFLDLYPEDLEANGILDRMAADEQEKAEKRERRYNTWMNIGNALAAAGNAMQGNSVSANTSYSATDLDNSDTNSAYAVEEETANCQFYQDSYARAERNAKSCYEALANAVRVKKNGQDVEGGRQVELGNIVTTNRLQKNLRETQKRMQEIRMKSARKGCSIPQSNYETISVTTTGVDLRMDN